MSEQTDQIDPSERHSFEVGERVLDIERLETTMGTRNQPPEVTNPGRGGRPTHGPALFLLKLDPETPVDEIGRLWEERESEFQLGGPE